MASKCCCICLTKVKQLVSLTNQDETEVTITNKLKFIAPEYEWLEVFFICPKCNSQLNDAYAFKKLCSSSNSFRKEFGLYSDFNSSCNENITIIKEDKEILIKEPNNKSGNSNTSIKQNNETFICYHCSKHFTNKIVLERHIHTTHFKTRKNKQQKFQCEICKEQFSLLKNIVKHCCNKHSMKLKDIKPYYCDFCNSKFASSSLLVQHKKYHKVEREFVCVSCGKSFITKRDLNSHEKLHENQRNYSCNKCNKSFNTNQNLKTHIYVVHTDSSQWKYSCHVCLKKFAMKANCNEHIKRHQGNKDFICHICKKLFVSNHELKKHVKLHSNIATFKCTNCPKDYRDKRSLNIHLFKVHNVGTCKLPIRVKKFVCHICPSQFFDNQKLQRHLRTHSGVKPFSCKECDKRFIDKSYLVHHLKNVHKIVKQEENDGGSYLI